MLVCDPTPVPPRIEHPDIRLCEFFDVETSCSSETLSYTSICQTRQRPDRTLMIVPGTKHQARHMDSSRAAPTIFVSLLPGTRMPPAISIWIEPRHHHQHCSSSGPLVPCKPMASDSGPSNLRVGDPGAGRWT